MKPPTIACMLAKLPSISLTYGSLVGSTTRMRMGSSLIVILLLSAAAVIVVANVCDRHIFPNQAQGFTVAVALAAENAVGEFLCLIPQTSLPQRSRCNSDKVKKCCRPAQ